MLRPRLVIAIVLGGWGLYRALYVVTMVLGGASPLLLGAFLLEAICGLAAGVGVWRGAAWAPLAVVLLGVAIAATALIEAFVLGIVAYLRALVHAVVAIVAMLLIAAYLRGETTALRA